MTVKLLQRKVEICETYAMTRTHKFNNNNNKVPAKSSLKWLCNLQAVAPTTTRNHRHSSISANFVADCQWMSSSGSNNKNASRRCSSITMPNFANSKSRRCRTLLGHLFKCETFALAVCSRHTSKLLLLVLSKFSCHLAKALAAHHNQWQSHQLAAGVVAQKDHIQTTTAVTTQTPTANNNNRHSCCHETTEEAN